MSTTEKLNKKTKNKLWDGLVNTTEITEVKLMSHSYKMARLILQRSQRLS